MVRVHPGALSKIQSSRKVKIMNEPTSYSQAVATATAQELAAAGTWAAEALPEQAPALTPIGIVRAVQRHYSGGWAQFTADLVKPPAEFPAHWEGMTMNDLTTFHSLITCNAYRGHLPMQLPGQIFPADHSGCHHA